MNKNIEFEKELMQILNKELSSTVYKITKLDKEETTEIEIYLNESLFGVEYKEISYKIKSLLKGYYLEDVNINGRHCKYIYKIFNKYK